MKQNEHTPLLPSAPSLSNLEVHPRQSNIVRYHIGSESNHAHCGYSVPCLNHYSTDHGGRLKQFSQIQWLTVIMLCITMALVSIILLFACVLPEEKYVESTCTLMKTFEKPYDCCTISNCQCLEAGVLAEPCSNNRLVSAPVCGLGPKCCSYSYGDYPCTKTVNQPCTINGQTTSCQQKVASMCTGQQCVKSVSNQLCSRQCTTCMRLETAYQFNAWTNILTMDCKSDASCVAKWTQSHPDGQQTSCWYNPNDGQSGALFVNPICTYSNAARLIVYLSGSIALLSLVALVWMSIKSKD